MRFSKVCDPWVPCGRINTAAFCAAAHYRKAKNFSRSASEPPNQTDFLSDFPIRVIQSDDR